MGADQISPPMITIHGFIFSITPRQNAWFTVAMLYFRGFRRVIPTAWILDGGDHRTRAHHATRRAMFREAKASAHIKVTIRDLNSNALKWKLRPNTRIVRRISKYPETSIFLIWASDQHRSSPAQTRSFPDPSQAVRCTRWLCSMFIGFPLVDSISDSWPHGYEYYVPHEKECGQHE